MARLHNIELETLKALPDFEQSNAFTSGERAAMALAQAMSATSPVISDSLYARVSEYYSQEQLVGLASIIAWENYRSRINHAFALQPEGFFAADRCPVPPMR